MTERPHAPAARGWARRATGRRVGWGGVWLLLAQLTGAPRAGAQEAAAQGAAVRVRITLDSMGRSSVRSTLRLAGDTASANGRFEYLVRPCVVVGAVTITNGRRRAPLAVDSGRAWRRLRDTAHIAGDGDSTGFDLQYSLELQGADGDLPLVMPQGVVVAAEGRNDDAVLVQVTTASAADRVTFPRLARIASSNEWVGRFVAVPSFVHVQRGGASGPRCAAPFAPGDDGGLTWRFWLLVAILGLWVPLYQWWARRSSEGDA